MEPVGPCVKCGKTVYCRDGFLDGVTFRGSLYCHSCFDEHDADGQPQAPKPPSDAKSPG